MRKILRPVGAKLFNTLRDTLNKSGPDGAALNTRKTARNQCKRKGPRNAALSFYVLRWLLLLFIVFHDHKKKTEKRTEKGAKYLRNNSVVHCLQKVEAAQSCDPCNRCEKQWRKSHWSENRKEPFSVFHCVGF